VGGPILLICAILLILLIGTKGGFAQSLAPQVYHKMEGSQVSETEIAKLRRENHQLREDNAQLQDASDILAALEAGGVDNWEGYEMALENV